MNKKGAIEDIVLIMVTLFGLAIVLLIGVYLANTFNTTVSPVFGNQSVNSTIGFQKVNDIANSTFNYIYLIVFMLFLILLIITAFMTPTHPIFFVLFIILFLFMILASVILSNVYDSISGTAIFATAVTKLPIQDLIMSNLPLVTAIVGVVLAIIIFSRSGISGGSAATQ